MKAHLPPICDAPSGQDCHLVKAIVIQRINDFWDEAQRRDGRSAMASTLTTLHSSYGIMLLTAACDAHV